MKKHLLLVVVIFVSFLLLATKSTAQTESLSETQSPLQLTAIPARLGDEDYSLKGKPGELVQTSVRVKNTSSKDQRVTSLVEDFTIEDDDNRPVPSIQETKWNLAKWITLSPSVQTLKPGELGTLSVLIQIPADAPPGGRYAMIMHSPGKLQDLVNGSGTGISQRVGTLVYFLVEGEIHQEAILRDIQVKNFFEFGPVPFSFIIENRSDIHLHPNIQIEIKNMLGQQSDLLTLESKNIFPEEQRSFSNTWNKKWGFGKYTATITANYGTEGKIVTGVFSFWIVPVKLILGVAFGIVLLIVLAILMKRKINDTALVKAEVKTQLEKKVTKARKNPPKTLEQFKDDRN